MAHVVGIRRRLLVVGVPLLAIGLLVSLGFASQLYAQATEQLTRISTDPYTNPTSNHKTQVEPDTFAFGDTTVAVFQTGRFYDGGASNIGYSTSIDGGTTWHKDFLPSTTVYATPAGKYARLSDPTVAYDPKHKVWVISYLGIKPTPTLNDVDVLVSRSTDGGLNFGPPVIVNASGHSNDKNWTVCDTWQNSPYYGNCYTEYDDNTLLNLVQMSTSTDGGRTWGEPKTTPDQACVIGGQPIVQPNGTVVVPIDDCFETAILSFRSTDGGRNWSRVTMAAQILANIDPGNLRSGPLPSAEVDSSGRVYVVWSDCRFEARCAAAAGTNDLLLITSDDGINWSLPVRIPTGRLGSGVDFVLPGVGVDKTTAGDDAHIGLVYYYFPDSTCGATATSSVCHLDVGFVSSTNGGRTWSGQEQLAGPMDLPWLPLTTQGYMVGDYMSTSIVPQTHVALPVFEVAFRPSDASGSCSGPNGEPGQDCNQATYTTAEQVVTGGDREANADQADSTAAGRAAAQSDRPALHVRATHR